MPPTRVRHIVDLEWAKPCAKPPSIPTHRGRPGSSNAAGHKFEAAVAAMVPGATQGQWFQFKDRNGLGYCQPDLLVQYGDLSLVLECKLSWTLTAYEQLTKLYLPVVAMAYSCPVRGLIVCKHLTIEAPPAAHTLAEALPLGLWHIPFPTPAPALGPLAAAAAKLRRAQLGAHSHAVQNGGRNA